MSRFVMRSILLISAIFLAAMPARAQGLLGADFRTATIHDLVSHFRFKEKRAEAGSHGTTTHHFVTDDKSLSLDVGVAADGKIVSLSLVVPRELIDDQKLTLAGRDIVKSFVAASMVSSSDYLKIHALIEEVDVRDLDLHPITINTPTFADSGRPIPKHAYKIGSGPLQRGDRITFIDIMPKLTTSPSAMYSSFSGRHKKAGIIYDGSRISFDNTTSDGTPVLVCVAFDEGFWQKNMASTTRFDTSDDANSKINQAAELLDLNDPVKSRLADGELQAAEKLGSTDFRIASLRALAAIQMGRMKKGLEELRDAISEIPSGKKFEQFKKDMKAVADRVESKIAGAAPYKVPPELRKYEIPPGTAAVVAEKDEATGLVTMGIGGGHDPDGGAQDGTDDGIIQVPWNNINRPSEVLPSK